MSSFKDILKYVLKDLPFWVTFLVCQTYDWKTSQMFAFFAYGMYSWFDGYFKGAEK